MKSFLAFLTIILPWQLRRLALIHIFKYKIDPTARIGFSFILPDRLEMKAHSRIGHLSVCKGISLLQMNASSSLGNLNWITGFPLNDQRFFSADVGRMPELILGEHAAITNRHMLDCTNSVHIGKFTTFAGFRSQILTHSIDLYECRQSSRPVIIGEYCFVGTACVLLGGCALPDYSVLGAGSLLNKNFSKMYFLYAGHPATPLKPLPKDMAYFRRTSGYVY